MHTTLISKPISIKITLATFKKFIRENKFDLFLLVNSMFDGMIDCISKVKMVPEKIKQTEWNFNKKNHLGINGIWLVGNSRDYFQPYEGGREGVKK